MSRGPFARATAFGLAVLLLGQPLGAAAQTRFAVVDLEPSPEHRKLVEEVEREIARLRPGSEPVENQALRRLLATGDGPVDIANRLLDESRRALRSGDCAAAVEKGWAAEEAILSAMSLDEERDPLKTLYMVLLECEDRLGHADAVTRAALRLHALVSLKPTELSQELWDKYVANASPPEPTIELQVDSDPVNAQLNVNLHGEGATPRTLKVAPGTVLVEVQKEGYKKAFRRLVVKDRPVRTALRLIQTAHDREEQAALHLRILRKNELDEQVPTLSRLAQLVRVETLVLLAVIDDDVNISFFDAERGALTEAPVRSKWDPETGRVAALAARATPGGAKATPGGAKATPAAEAGQDIAAATAEAGEKANGEPRSPLTGAALPEAQAVSQKAKYVPRRKRPGAPWWSWVIAGAVAAGFLTFMFSDTGATSDTIAVRASWPPATP